MKEKHESLRKISIKRRNCPSFDTWKKDFNTVDFANLFVTKIGYLVNQPKQYFTNWFVRHDYCIQYIISGKGEYFINNQLYNLKKNTLFLLPKDKYHYYKSDPDNPYEYYWIHFNGVGFENFLNTIGLSEDSPVIFDIENPNIEKCFKDLMDISKSKSPYSNLLLLSKSYSLLYEIASAIPVKKEEKEKEFNAIVETSINYITENYQSQITLDELAAITFTNKCYLVTLFKKETGLSPIQFLIQHRVNQACALLQTNMTVTEICYKVGFAELTNFLVRFKRITGVTPTEFRKNLRATTQE